MPPLIGILPALAAIGGLASAGTTIGMDIANSGGPSTPTPTPVASTAPSAQQQQATQMQQKAAVGEQLPTVEGLTSGFANPGYYAQQGGTDAGTAGQPGGQNSALSAVESAFGLPPGSLSKLSGGFSSGGSGGGGSAPGTPQKFTPAGAGNTSQGAFPEGQPDLSAFVNTFFKG